MELGLHIADFTWAGGPPALGRTLAETARHAEAAGIARITVMDHLWQMGDATGPRENDMLEAYTTLGFLAANTERVLLHTLVTAAVYRHPGVLAKQVSTLDVLSGGRAGLGIGAAWYEDEARGLGIPFPPTAERFTRLEETLQICLQMWGDGDGAYQSEHYQLARTLNSPQNLSVPHPYLMVGGTGERKTLRLVARYADACNLFGGPGARHKLDVLRGHCDAVGRDYDTVEKTVTFPFTPNTTRGDLVGQLLDLREAGFTVAYAFGQGFPDPRRAIDLLTSALPEVAEA
ncbi:LLM class F420-dependent oxidoreductase [Nocardiopsis tropica]|jgi:F420-dependent oxidoreductase-like protein|uniref:LLM class F420-dependent oxidoreductase n=1 Tax=Nocardiopsis tropica TaxID=109330 RepID=A0ABU7KL56_9ACTN|nr:LLM class F420-dependent oxidoreductase [Nocardiopsis umidischolae]MEE2050019.1 LLM class F420-dependent oxidoreductase [Nocardiopsis umidischolae]